MHSTRPHLARVLRITGLVAGLAVPAVGCSDDAAVEPDHGPIADGITARLGDPLPTATAEQLATFDRGLQVARRRFDIAEGLGPAFNVTFCGSCHEKPTIGGSAGMYRNFFLAGIRLDGDGPFFPGNRVELFDCGDPLVAPEDRVRNPPPESALGVVVGVIRMFYYGPDNTARPDPQTELNVITQRNPIPFFGVGLLAELDEAVILAYADPDDENGDGISGRPNYDRGFVGRFGRKAQTVSIEGFIRGPLFNHLGITTDPLTEEQRAQLPVDSSAQPDSQAVRWLAPWVQSHAQAAAPSGPNCDVDDVQDPEMSGQDLFDLISFSMLLAAPEFESLSEQGKRGMGRFDGLGCGACHVPRLDGPRGPLPVYSDLLLHDMGQGLADGFEMGEAKGYEFRTQPLWGLAATGPYLHDGRAHTIQEAILWHGGEAEPARDGFEALSPNERDELIEFLLSLGGREQASLGLLPFDTPLPAPGEYGGPYRALSLGEESDFLAGRTLFDREFGTSEGLGGPRMNGDSCRACHFLPTIGGAGPRGVNVMRHGIINDNNDFVAPAVGTILHKLTSLVESANFPQPQADVFEHRQSPPLFGLGLIESIAEETIVANADADDLDGDGISGRVSRIDSGRLGRFGWKAQVPSLDEFVRDAVSAELGMTLPIRAGSTFGRIQDNDEIPDPEFTLDNAANIALFMALLAPPPRQTAADPDAADRGQTLFDTTGCASCHTPSLMGADGPVPLYSDLLLHEILPSTMNGIEEASANMWEFRTPPLWGISQTAPYLHSGTADTLDQAIRAHDGEAMLVRDAYLALTADQQADLLMFLSTL
jgi:CxxC motif-containing protein (DUF1111 family)